MAVGSTVRSKLVVLNGSAKIGSKPLRKFANEGGYRFFLGGGG